MFDLIAFPFMFLFQIDFQTESVQRDMLAILSYKKCPDKGVFKYNDGGPNGSLARLGSTIRMPVTLSSSGSNDFCRMKFKRVFLFTKSDEGRI